MMGCPLLALNAENDRAKLPCLTLPPRKHILKTVHRDLAIVTPINFYRNVKLSRRSFENSSLYMCHLYLYYSVMSVFALTQPL